jgi:Tol biopolymer transport system component
VTVAIGKITPVHFEISCSSITRFEKIAYTIDSTVVGGSTRRMVGLMNPDGTGAAVLAVGDAPSWSPDGRRLVLTEVVCTPSYYGVYYGYSCAGGLVIVDPEMGTRTSVGGAAAAFSPAWSPTGDLIAFTRCCESTDRNAIYLVKPDGSLSARLPISQVVTAGDPGWSPDGKRIAFTCSSTGNATDLCVVNSDGSGFARLTTNVSVAVGRPAWKPDGTSIAFTADERGAPTVALLNLASGAITRVTEGSQPAWSRNASLLVFSGVRPAGLYTVNVDGPFVAPLANGAYSAPTWRP